MIKSVSFWSLRPGVDPEKAEKQYYEVHIPKAKKIPGLRKYTIGKAIGKDRACYRLAELYFDNKEAMKAAFSSELGKAAIGDPGFLALIQDRTVMYFEEEEVI